MLCLPSRVVGVLGLVVMLSVTLPPTTVQAQVEARTTTGPRVAPGDTLSFTTADGGSIACAELDFLSNTLPLAETSAERCNNARYGAGLLTWTEPATNKIAAMSAHITGPLIHIPGWASSSIYNQFTVTDHHRADDGRRRRGSIVDAQVAITYDFVAQSGGASLYRNEVSLGLRVEDGTAGLPVGARSLLSYERTGDQGLTDIAGSLYSTPVDDGTDHVSVKLRRGHVYRLHFELTAANHRSGGVRAQAQWSKLVVTVDEDADDD